MSNRSGRGSRTFHLLRTRSPDRRRRPLPPPVSPHWPLGIGESFWMRRCRRVTERGRWAPVCPSRGGPSGCLSADLVTRVGCFSCRRLLSVLLPALKARPTVGEGGKTRPPRWKTQRACQLVLSFFFRGLARPAQAAAKGVGEGGGGGSEEWYTFRRPSGRTPRDLCDTGHAFRLSRWERRRRRRRRRLVSVGPRRRRPEPGHTRWLTDTLRLST